MSGYLIEDIGKPISLFHIKNDPNKARKILYAMLALHLKKQCHGSCRIDNIIEVDGKMKWIDSRGAKGEATNCHHDDIISLIKSMNINQNNFVLKLIAEEYVVALTKLLDCLKTNKNCPYDTSEIDHLFDVILNERDAILD
jgi:hypothetical protein